MDIERLISEVEKRLAIWDPRDSKHCNRDLIVIYWAEISENVQLQGMYRNTFVISIYSIVFTMI